MATEGFDAYAPGSLAGLALGVLAHKWTLSIVFALRPGAMRFNELRRQVRGVTPEVLTQSLRSLERDGIVARRDFVETCAHVEYCLNPLGTSLCEPARAIQAWADQHGQEVIEARQRYDARPPPDSS